MPSVLSRAAELERKFLKYAPKQNQEKIKEVLEIYKDRANLSFNTVQNMVLALYSPSVLGKDGKGKVDKMYENFLSKYQNDEKHPQDWTRYMTAKEKLEERRDRLLGVKRTYQLFVAIYTQERRMDPAKREEYLAATEKEAKKVKMKKIRGLAQITRMHITVQAYSSRVLEELRWKLARRGTKEFRQLYPICMTDKAFAERDRKIPGYIDAIYIMDWAAIGKQAKTGVLEEPTEAKDPKISRKRSGDKVAIAFKYCSYQLDTAKRSFKDALRKGEHRASECWINTIYDNFKDKLLRPDKTKNVITRETILQVLGRTEEDIKDGLTIDEVLPFFQKYKLKLRVYDVFYNLIFKYDPDTPNFNNPALFCVTDGDHIYTLNTDLDRLAQKTASDEYQVTACPNFYTPEKQAEKANYRVVEHIDEILGILREMGDDEEKVVYLVHKTDNLEAIVWQLYDAGYRPNLKYGVGKLSWVSLTVNKTTFVFRCQQMIDWAIDGCMEVSDAGVFNRSHDAKTEFHYQLFKAEHKSFYDDQDLQILDECRTIANVGWLKSLTGPVTSSKHRPKAISKSSLVEIDISKAYTGAFMRIKAIPVFNEFDVWQPYNGEAIRKLSLYIVEASEFDLFFNKKYNLVYGCFLKQLPTLPTIKAVKHPSVIKKVDYAKLVAELWGTRISDDNEEDQTLKKTIANCSYGMLEKQINKKVKSKIFDTYEDAKFFQLKYGGDITFIKQYEQTTTYKEVSILDKGVEEAEMSWQLQMTPTGKCLFILNLSAECSLNNGFRYIKELLLQQHNFYLNKCWKILQEAGVDVYTVKTDSFTIPSSKLEQAEELLNWEAGIGSWRFSRSDDIKYPDADNFLQLKTNTLQPLREHPVRPITLQDEYDMDTICRHFEEKKRIMIRAEYAGCGKSYACKQMEQRGHKVLFVCPTNKLASNYGENGCTINRFFSIGMTEESKMAKFDDSSYDTIVFDEIFFASVRKLARIKRYCDEHPDKIVIATGDTNQLECIDCITNQHDYDEYYNKCVDLIFPDNMYFKENKRLKRKKDKETLRQFKQDIFDETIPAETTIKKYFKMTKDLETVYNVAYRNATCEKVSQRVRSELLRKMGEYCIGEVLVCRTYFKIRKQVFNVNYEYKITALECEAITLNNTLLVPIDTVRKNFIHAYCRTCHSFQGTSLDERLTIFDWKFAHVNRKWLYTAVTRATELKNVLFYDYDENAEREEATLQYFSKKVERYKQQDKRAKREVKESCFVTVKWLMGCLGKSCSGCGDALVYEKGKSNLTANRIDNSVGHEIDNVVPMCCWCNCALSNK